MSSAGRLGLCMAPGRTKKKPQHDWARDLSKDLDRIRDHYKCDILVTLVRFPELRAIHTPNLFDETEIRGMDSIHFPIKDKYVPSSMEQFMVLIDTIIDKLKEGKCVVVHCNGGKGRSGTVLVATLVALGRKVQQAIEVVRKARSGTIQNPLQIAYVKNFKTSWRKFKKHLLKEQEKRNERKGTHQPDDPPDPDDETYSPEEIDALKSFQNKANANDQDKEEKVVIYTHRTFIPEEPIKDTSETNGQLAISNSPNPQGTIQPSALNATSQPPKKEKETSKGLWFMKGGVGDKKTENQKKITRQQKKETREAKKRQQQAVGKQKNKNKEKKPNALSQSRAENHIYSKAMPTDYDGIEAIEPIEMCVDDFSTDDDEPRGFHTNEKKSSMNNDGVEESMDIVDDTDEETVE